MNKITEHRFFHEIFFPFRGTWHMPWIIERYVRGALKAFTPSKIFNALVAMGEMHLGKIHVRSRPVVLRIEPCNTCNLRCPLCACGLQKDPRSKGYISVDDFSRILKENPQAIIARLDGMGEPTMHPRIFDLIRMAKNAGLSTVLHSNFCTSACDRIDMFLESGLDRLVISIDGATPSTYNRYRVGGDLEQVIQRTRHLLKEKRSRSLKYPIVEIQMVDLPFNRHERQLIRNLTKDLGADRFQLTEAEQSTKKATYHPARPRRCPWLWTVLTVGWNLDYHSCTNAWSFGWPRLNMRDVSADNFWNHPLLKEARSYNLDKSSTIIACDDDCKCSQCYEMVVVPLTGRYFNE